jgi:hypothetical protein
MEIEGTPTLDRPERRRSSFWLKLAGWGGCVLVGVPGVLLPIIPGIPFFILGLVLLSSQYAWAHRLLQWAQGRFSPIRRNPTGALRNNRSARFHRIAGIVA